MGVSCARQAGISGGSSGQSKRQAEHAAKQRRSHCRLPPRRSSPGPATGRGKREGDRKRERERERKEGEACGAERRQRNRRWTNILIYLLLFHPPAHPSDPFDPPRRVGLGAPVQKRINKSHWLYGRFKHWANFSARQNEYDLRFIESIFAMLVRYYSMRAF